MLRKHINHEGSFSVDVNSTPAQVGPGPCPQAGCQSSSGTGPYSKGNVVYEEYGGNSGDYVTSLPCKCCDGKGYLASGEKAYYTYCRAHNVRNLSTGYPDPIGMSKQVYDDPEIIAGANSKRATASAEKSSGGCYIATAVYGSYDCTEVLALRRFRDKTLKATAPGKLLIRIYYFASPRLATRISRSSRTSRILRVILNSVAKRVA